MQNASVSDETPACAHAAICDGGNGALGHPKVYLAFQLGRATCSYCGRQFAAPNIVAEIGA